MTSLEELDGPLPIQDLLKSVAETINPQTILPQKEFRSTRPRTFRTRARNFVQRVRGKTRSKANVQKQRAARKAQKKARKAEAAAKKAQQQTAAGKKPSAGTAKDAVTNPPDKPTKPKDGTPNPTKKTKEQKDAAAATADVKKKSWLDKMAAIGPAGLLAIGLTTAIAAKIAADTAEAYINCETTDITISKIEPKPDWGALSWLLGDKASKLTVTFTASKSYEPLENSDVWTFRGTGRPELDDKQFKIIAVNDDGTVVIKCGQSDCSKIKASSGSADTECDFGDRANQAIEDNATDFASTASRIFKGLFAGLFAIIPIILFLFVAYFFIKFALSFRKT